MQHRGFLYEAWSLSLSVVQHLVLEWRQQTVLKRTLCCLTRVQEEEEEFDEPDEDDFVDDDYLQVYKGCISWDSQVCTADGATHAVQVVEHARALIVALALCSCSMARLTTTRGTTTILQTMVTTRPTSKTAAVCCQCTYS